MDLVFFCGSLVGKKGYQTTIELRPKICAMMRNSISLTNGPCYRNNMMFGLAPGGKVRVWFNSQNSQADEIF